jgi:DNA invertase Pin-like site-specific DNA recombinase
MTSTAAIYARQSKDSELGIERQVEQCTALASARSWQVTVTLRENDTSASSGKARPEYDKLLALVKAKSIDIVIVAHVDRLLRKLTDLEHLITLAETSGVKVAAVSGDLDLSSDSGRLVARILASVARGEVERKGKRQRDAAQQAAKNGKRWTGCPRPFGWADDHRTKDPDEAAAIRDACATILAQGTVSSIARDWSARGLRPPQAPFGPLPQVPWTRNTVTTILRNPRIAGLSTYKGDVVHGEDGQPVAGDWQAIVPLETWQAVTAILTASDRTVTYAKDGKSLTRKIKTSTPRGVRTLLGGVAECRCGNKMIGGTHSGTGHHILRCNPVTRGQRPGPHASVRADQVTEEVETRLLAMLSVDVDLLIEPKPDTDVTALREEAAVIRANLSELGADRALGLISRDQLITATERGNARLEEISHKLTEAASESALAPFVTAEDAFETWDRLPLDRRRAVLRAVTPVTVFPAGRGARRFDPATVKTPRIPVEGRVSP